MQDRRIQERMDSGMMDSRKDGFKKGWIQERRDARKEGCKKGGMQEGDEGCKFGSARSLIKTYDNIKLKRTVF